MWRGGAIHHRRERGRDEEAEEEKRDLLEAQKVKGRAGKGGRSLPLAPDYFFFFYNLDRKNAILLGDFATFIPRDSREDPERIGSVARNTTSYREKSSFISRPAS
jgi:hypothetical protein